MNTKDITFGKDKSIFLLIGPSVLGFFIFYVLPFALSFYFTLVDNSIGGNFVGAANFAKVLSNTAFQRAVKNTLIFLVMYLPASTVLPLVLALCVSRLSSKWQNAAIFIFLLPLVIPSSSMVNFWQAIVGLNGLINKIFFTANPVDWINSDASRFIITLIFLWKNTGYNMIFFLTGLNFIPKEYYEFARVEGAGELKIILRVILPSLIPSFFLVLVMSIINSFNSFKEIHLLAGFYPHSSIYMLQHYINNQFAALDYQKLATASYIIAVLFFITSFGILRYQNKTLGRV